jgi:tRNA U34 5-carboxymethylaminomethyl modifying GTPase MnmE/TrmE
MSVGKGCEHFDIVDTAGLSDSVLDDAMLRQGMAQTLSTLKDGGIILHLIDASQAATSDPESGISAVDRQLARFCGAIGAYALLANKMDLPGAAAGLAFIKKAFPERHVIPVSALRQDGFKEVRGFVRRAL